MGSTKTDESDSYVPIPPDLSREIAEWIAVHPQRDDPRAFLFLNRNKRAFSVGNYLKKQLKPLAESVGILDLTQQAFRRTSSTHIQKHGTVKDMQRHLRHSDPETTLKHYAKAIPERLRAAVAKLDEQIRGIKSDPAPREADLETLRLGVARIEAQVTTLWPTLPSAKLILEALRMAVAAIDAQK